MSTSKPPVSPKRTPDDLEENKGDSIPRPQAGPQYQIYVGRIVTAIASIIGRQPTAQDRRRVGSDVATLHRECQVSPEDQATLAEWAQAADRGEYFPGVNYYWQTSYDKLVAARARQSTGQSVPESERVPTPAEDREAERKRHLKFACQDWENRHLDGYTGEDGEKCMYAHCPYDGDHSKKPPPIDMSAWVASLKNGAETATGDHQ